MARGTKGAELTKAQKENLARNNFKNRSKEEMAEIVRKSKEARKRNKTEQMELQKCMKTLLTMEVRGNNQREVLRKFGFTDEQITNKTLLMVALFQKGITGDVGAIKEIVNMMEKLDMFNTSGKVQSNVIINLMPVGEQYQPNEKDEQDIWDVENSSEWMEEEKNTEWNTDAGDWGREVYDPD